MKNSDSKNANPKILLVDDQTSLMIFNSALRRLTINCEILTVPDSQEALDVARSEQPDLIISSDHMPVFNAFELFDELQKDEMLRLIPFMVLSGDPTSKHRIDGRFIDAFMTKPIDINEFIFRVRRLLGPALRYKSKQLSPKPDKKLKVFLCHAKEDKARAIGIYEKLKIHGVQPWLDEFDLIPGHDWSLEISNAIRQADLVMVLLSNNSVNKRGYVQREIKIALDLHQNEPESGIYLVPTLLETCEVPKALDKIQWVRLYEESGFQKLSRTFRTRATVVDAQVPDEIS